MEQPVRIVSTKKLQPNQRQYLLNAGLSVTDADFISISFKNFDITIIKSNVIITSQNAFKALLANKEVRDYNYYCVGEKTCNFITGKGCKVVAYANNAEQLAEVIINDFAETEFTFLSGNIRHNALPLALKNADVQFNEINVYETVLSSHKINSKPDALLFFSPSSVISFLQENSITNEACFCIGETTAKALQNVTENIIVANKPSVENVIIQCINHYKNK